ncbi:hypothetical protein [Streptosporangium carneum]|uniref:Uncharacterized protein n=1 Tax=Streptosporangium carneum TaxID=47481 RepID=A0A9W6I006_9ACTN|nr:hypothetical protein [Streptosporangium carneum]GLK08693.1 hypothetical protein GCM10017600_20980 [Streptosporangium carneum]
MVIESGDAAAADVIAWRPSAASGYEYGYVDGLRCFTLKAERDFHCQRCWTLVINLPGPKGLIGQERGYTSRDAAIHRAATVLMQVAEVFAAVWRSTRGN